MDSAFTFLTPHSMGGPSMVDKTPKKRVLEVVEQLPDDATVEDAMERLYFIAKIERGLAQANAGETIPHEQAKIRLMR